MNGMLYDQSPVHCSTMNVGMGTVKQKKSCILKGLVAFGIRLSSSLLSKANNVDKSLNASPPSTRALSSSFHSTTAGAAGGPHKESSSDSDLTSSNDDDKSSAPSAAVSPLYTDKLSQPLNLILNSLSFEAKSPSAFAIHKFHFECYFSEQILVLCVCTCKSLILPSYNFPCCEVRLTFVTCCHRRSNSI